MSESVEVSVDVAAPAERVYDLVADLTAMGRWSPENTGGRWLGGATAAVPGARFKGTNRRGMARWSTVCTIVTAEPGREIAWDVAAGPFTVARWTYRFADRDGGCTVTERWDDLRRGRLMHVVGRLGTGVKDRTEHNRATMQQTLERLKGAAESG